MLSGDPVELNFDGLEMQKWNIPTDRAEKRGYLSSCHVYYQSYGY